MTQAHYIVGDTRQVTATLPDGCIDLVLTSPPFLALRSYLPADHPDKANEIGSEPTPAEFLDVLLELTAQWGRVLAPHGSIAVELGDTFSGSGGAGGDYAADGWREGQEQFSGTAHRSRNQPNGAWPLAKSLALIPELYRIGLAYGINPLTGTQSPAGRWRVRNVVRWHRPNPPVGALGDKYRPATTDMVIATRARDRWFDLYAVRGPYSENSHPRTAKGVDRHTLDDVNNDGSGAPPLDTWIIPTHPYKGAHYATWPPALCEIPIKSMCPLEVCRTCGTPRRRITENVTTERFRDPPTAEEFALHLIVGMKYAHITIDDLAEMLDVTPRMVRHWRAETNTPQLPSINRWRQMQDIMPFDNDCRDRMTVVGPEYEGKDRGYRAIPGRLSAGHARDDRPKVVPKGWSDCGCDSPAYRPGVVLDPFAGTGTTLAVATGHGRHAIGIDLDPRNLNLANDRIGPLILTNGPELPDWLRT